VEDGALKAGEKKQEKGVRKKSAGETYYEQWGAIFETETLSHKLFPGKIK